ncbi:MAG: hypothetical protein R3F11_26010 [Verrucomicrobiales bacterium]
MSQARPSAIEPGTTIYGTEDLAEDTRGSLVVARGAKIMAAACRWRQSCSPPWRSATPDRSPWTTTSSGAASSSSAKRGSTTIPPTCRGNGFLETEGGTDYVAREIEGFPTGGAAGTLIRYGGIHDDDNSGVFAYVSIRYGGYIFDPVNNSEINGLTLGCVGNETEIHHVEVFNNADDGIEFFGGTVDVHHMVMAFNEDDCYDIDEGYRASVPCCHPEARQEQLRWRARWGGSPQKNLQPFATPHFTMRLTSDRGRRRLRRYQNGFHLRDNFAGQYCNSVFHDFKGFFVTVDNNADMTQRINDGTCSSLSITPSVCSVLD